MCGRYNFTVEQNEEVIEILEKLNARLHKNAVKNNMVKTGEVFPADAAPILIEEEGIVPVLSNWGFPKFDQKGVIINARAETASAKRTFCDSLVNRRCIIPSTGFYEWDSEKKKYLFQLEGRNALYMAGLYTRYRNELRFVILTTAANASMKEIHNRMPLVILRQQIADWITDYSAAKELLEKVPPRLVKQEVSGKKFGYQYKMDL